LNELSRTPRIAAGRLSTSSIRALAARGAGPDGRRFWIPLFLLPFLLLYGGFTLWPLLATAYYSLFNWDGIRPLTDFVGLGNYEKIVADPIFWLAFKNTLVFAVVETAIKLPLALLVAILLTRRWLLFKTFFRTVFFLPIILPVALAGLVFTYLLNPSNGAIDSFLADRGWIHTPIDLLGHGNTALIAIILVAVWQIFGQYMVYWMAALQNVPEDVYEAADIDGANELQKLIHITLPLIRPVALIITLLAIVNALHVFGVIVTLTAGGPGQASYTVSYFIYNEAFSEAPFRYGYGSAAALLFAVLAFMFVTGQAAIARGAERVRKDYSV
jgi:ABC-type sugar transport system permease subunit